MWVCKISKCKLHAIISNCPPDKRIARSFWTMYRFSRSTKYVHKFKYRSSSVGDKGGIHIPQYLAELSHNPFHACPPSKEDAGRYKYSFLKEFMMDHFFLVKTWHIKVHRSQYRGEPTGHQEAASAHTSAASFTSGFSVYFSDITLSIRNFDRIYW